MRSNIQAISVILFLPASLVEQKTSLHVGQIIPRNVKTITGSSVTFYCASFEQPTWFHRNLSNVIVDGRHTLERKKIILKNLRQWDSGRYYCWGQYVAGHRFITSVYLTVVNRIKYGEVLPNKAIVLRRYYTILYCGSSRPVDWISASMYNRTLNRYNRIRLRDINLYNSGNYLCRGTTLNKDLFHFKVEIIFKQDILIMLS